MKKYISLLFLLLTISQSVFAEDGVIESMHESGKIYPVIAVLSVIFIGIILFLIRQEKKIKQLEDQLNNKG